MQDENDKIFTREFLGRLASIGFANFVYHGFRIFFIFAVGVNSLDYFVDHPEPVVLVMMVGSWLGVWKCVGIADRWFNKRFGTRKS